VEQSEIETNREGPGSRQVRSDALSSLLGTAKKSDDGHDGFLSSSSFFRGEAR